MKTSTSCFSSWNQLVWACVPWSKKSLLFEIDCEKLGKVLMKRVKCPSVTCLFLPICFFLAWLPERQLWGTLGICKNPRWPLWTPGSPPDGISFNWFTYNHVWHLFTRYCLPGESIFGINLGIRGHSIGQMSSSRSFSVKECSTTGHVLYVLDLENKFSTTKTSQHETLTVLCKKLCNLCSLDGDTSTVQQGPLHPGQLDGLHGKH